MLNSLSIIPDLKINVSTMLFGDINLSTELSIQVFDAVHTFIKESKRFT